MRGLPAMRAGLPGSKYPAPEVLGYRPHPLAGGGSRSRGRAAYFLRRGSNDRTLEPDLSTGHGKAVLCHVFIIGNFRISTHKGPEHSGPLCVEWRQTFRMDFSFPSRSGHDMAASSTGSGTKVTFPPSFLTVPRP